MKQRSGGRRTEAIRRELGEGDLRTIGKAARVVERVRTQGDFDALFPLLWDGERTVAMRAADAIEKMSAKRPEFLEKHRTELVKLALSADRAELQWHLAQMLPRLVLSPAETDKVWSLLMNWAGGQTASRIARVNALQGLAELLPGKPESALEFKESLEKWEREGIPSLNARIKKIRKKLAM